MKKKFLFLATIAVMVFVSLFAAACKSSDDSESTKNPTSSESQTSESASSEIERLVMSETEVTVVLGEDYSLRATDGKNELRCKWTSGDKTVATVNEYGLVTAIKRGETTVTAEYRGKTATCKVTVNLGGNVPRLEIDGEDEGLSVDLAHSANLGGRVIFNGKYYDDAEIVYTVEDPTVGKVVNGVFRPLKAGKTTITATAEWRGETSEFLTADIEMTVNHSVNVYVGGKPIPDEVDIYTIENFDGETYDTFWYMKPTANVDGAEVVPTVTLDDESVIEYDEAAGRIIAKKYGVAEVTFSYKGEEAEINKRVVVNVIRPVAEYPNLIEDFSAVGGKFKENGVNILETLFKNGISAAEQDGKPLDVSKAGRVLGVRTEEGGISACKVTVYAEDFGYTFNLEGALLVATEAEDLLDFKLTEENPNLKGYACLKADLDMSTLDFNGDGKTARTGEIAAYDTFYPYFTNMRDNVKGSTAMLSGNGFSGVFEGNGHKIINYHAGNSYGFFGNISNAVIRNVAFTEVDVYCNDSRGIVLAEKASAATFENVYVSVNTGDHSNANYVIKKEFSLLGCVDSVDKKFTNCVLEYDKTYEENSTSAWGYGAVGVFAQAGTTVWYADPSRVSLPGHKMKFSIKGFYLVAPKAANGRAMPLIQYNGVSVYADNDFADLAEGGKFMLGGDGNPTANENGTQAIYHWGNAYRYDSFVAMAEEVTSVGGWTVTSDGLVWNE